MSSGRQWRSRSSQGSAASASRRSAASAAPSRSSATRRSRASGARRAIERSMLASTPRQSPRAASAWRSAGERGLASADRGAAPPRSRRSLRRGGRAGPRARLARRVRSAARSAAVAARGAASASSASSASRVAQPLGQRAARAPAPRRGPARSRARAADGGSASAGPGQRSFEQARELEPERRLGCAGRARHLRLEQQRERRASPSWR